MEPKQIRSTLQNTQKMLRFIMTDIADPQAARLLKIVQEDIQSCMPTLDSWAATTQVNGKPVRLMNRKLTIRRGREIDEYRKDHCQATAADIAGKFNLREETVQQYLEGRFRPSR